METLERESYPYRPGLEKVPAAISDVCYLDGDIGTLEYRGYPIEALADGCTYEETAYLLLNSDLPNRNQLEEFSTALKQHRRLKPQIVDLMRILPGDGHPMHA